MTPQHQALSENSVVRSRASGFSSDKDGEAGDIGCIVDGAGRRPDQKQAARSQTEFSDKASASIIQCVIGAKNGTKKIAPTKKNLDLLN